MGVVTEDVPAISSPVPTSAFSMPCRACKRRPIACARRASTKSSCSPTRATRSTWNGRRVGAASTSSCLATITPCWVTQRRWKWSRPVRASGSGPYPTVTAGADGVPVLVVSGYEWGRWLGRLKVNFDERGIIQQWEADPMFVRGCAFVRGAVDCSRQRAPEGRRSGAGRTLPRADGPIRPGGDRADRDGVRRRPDTGPAHPGNATGQSDRRHDADDCGPVGWGGGGDRQLRRHPGGFQCW